MNATGFGRMYEALERFGAAMVRSMDEVYSRTWLRFRRRSSGRVWPVAPGAYVLGDPRGTIAICTLTSAELAAPAAALPNVAIAGRLYTCNVGIEKIVANVAANPHIRTLMMCGKESPLFKPAQALASLAASGVDDANRIIGAEGYLPVLSGARAATIHHFRQRVRLVDRTGLTDARAIAAEVAAISAANVAAADESGELDAETPPLETLTADDDDFVEIRPGGVRQSLAYDPKGYIVIDVERDAERIVARHFCTDGSRAHIMRGRSAEGMALGFIREGLITQLTHAAYLGAELEKAESALRLGLLFEQDKPLRR